MASSLGNCETMKVLIELCPGCSDFIDNKGRNILHVAVENKKNKAIEIIVRDKSLTNLIDQKDKDGNTPIHLLDVSDQFEKMGMLLTPLDLKSSYDQKRRLIKAILTHPV
ncbi:hypothetical protein L1987_58225 [Smallanthus sonchifolius]|uniref:Uncharacterized protein n=1 Tax=Smallanthus sonchifolius TaxID=185202 RepID=A0ACB9DF56_9ASTR|nr:hypothetical protein L1987_58225 [Smallanthus sonchifolius]